MNNTKIDMEIIISRFLRIGMIVSAVIISIGMGMFLVTGKSGYAGNFYPTAFNEIFQGIISLKSYAVIMAGLLCLILLPVGRVVLSLILFYKERDFLYVKITLVVLIVLMFGFIAGEKI